MVDNIAPIKEVRIKNRTEPWIDSEILHSINARDRAYQTFKRDQSDQNYSVFKALRNKTQGLIYRAKKDYFKTKIENENNDSKSLWQSLTDLGMPSKKSKTASSNIGLKTDNEVCLDKPTCTEKFNELYTTVASNLVKKQPKSLNKFGKKFVENFYRSKGVKPNSYSFFQYSLETKF